MISVRFIAKLISHDVICVLFNFRGHASTLLRMVRDYINGNHQVFIDKMARKAIVLHRKIFLTKGEILLSLPTKKDFEHRTILSPYPLMGLGGKEPRQMFLLLRRLLTLDISVLLVLLCGTQTRTRTIKP